MSERAASSATDALYLSWRLSATDPGVAGRTRRHLRSGETRRLYQLRSWVIVAGEVRALLSPSTTLERIVDAIWGTDSQPVSTRWVSTRDFARIAHDIETTPVNLGLASRPEQWPMSSAASL